MALPDRPTRVLVQELSDHGLRDGMDNCGVGRYSGCTLGLASTVLHVKNIDVAVPAHMVLEVLVGRN